MTDEDQPPAEPTKLTRTKEGWARVKQFLKPRASQPESSRLPPGQHLVKDWPVLDLGLTPKISQEKWRLTLAGHVENPAVWTWEEMMSLPQSQFVSDIHCVTTWSRYDNRWDGVSTRDVLEAVKPTAAARFVVLHAFDGYTTNLSLEDFAAEDALLAHHWEGKPLTAEHGGPLRLVLPRLYFWKSPKWLKRIEFRAEDEPGYWEVRGYHNRGDPWDEQRYSD